MQLLHGQELVDTLHSCCQKVTSRVWIAVPYLGSKKSLQNILGKVLVDHSKINLRLLTDIEERNNFSIESLKMFYDVGTVKHLLALHAKIYIIDNICLLTSANLTSTAFSRRHEIGMLLDEDESKGVISLYKKYWNEAEEVTERMLDVSFPSNGASNEERMGKKYKQKWNLPSFEEPTYWFKPIGHSQNKIKPGQKRKSKEYLHFAARPSGVKIDDILVIYGVGDGRVLSIFKVLTSPIKLTDDELMNKYADWSRWPWYVRGINITPNYGKSWWNYDLNAHDMAKTYLDKKPKGFITLKGKTLGALNHRLDKFRLNKEFAFYIMDRIIKHERTLIK